ncbi:hypothetical protein [Bdellovibrio sp. HCB2-146]|uniref:hypothetical protein n=1 Tax=Bdellovibrio sp. HCB2-146 TaxID=3394362 RepID=UPI0039BCA178
MKNWLAIGMSLVLASSGVAQEKCEDIFETRTLSISDDSFAPALQADKERSKILALKILQMAAFGRSVDFTEKQVLEKGELLLARTLNDGWSMEAEYGIDQRGAAAKFRMKKLLLVKPNGEEIVLDKSPIDVSGLKFNNRFYTVEQFNSSLKSASLEFPVTVEGALYDQVVKWAAYSDHLKSEELRALQSEKDLNVLRLKVFGRGVVDYTNKVIKKQSFKFALLGFVMYLYTQKDEVRGKIFVDDPWEKILKNGGVNILPAEEYAAFISSFSLFEGPLDFFKMGLGPKSETNVKYIDFSKLATYIEDLNRIERSKSGRPVVIYSDAEAKKVSILNYKKFGGQWGDSVQNASSMVVIYPVTKRALVLSSDLVHIEGEEDTILPIAIDGTAYPELYNYLVKQVKSAKKDSK